MEIYNIRQASANLSKIIENAANSHKPAYIIGKHNEAVLISKEDYRSLIETLYITSVPGLKDSILRAMAEPIETFSEGINWDNI